MFWLIFALLAPLLWAIGDVTEKFQLEKIFKEWLSYFTLMYIVWSGFVVVIFLLNPITFDPVYILLALSAGFIGTIAVIFYLKAVAREEASRVVPLSYIGLVFVAILAYLFLHEVFNVPKYIGMGLLIMGAVMISYKKSKDRRFPLTPVLSLIILFGLLDAVSDTLDKFFLLKYDYWSLLFWGYFGGLVVIASLLAKKSNRLQLSKIAGLKRRYWFLIGISTVVYFIGDVIWLAALSKAPLSLVAALGTTEPFFVFLITLLLSLFVPKILKEEISRSIVSLKLVSIFLIMLGAYLVAV